MSNYFGKNCNYLSVQWEDNEITGGPQYKDSSPVLVFCNHPDNKGQFEGNCNEKQCPRCPTCGGFGVMECADWDDFICKSCDGTGRKN